MHCNDYCLYAFISSSPKFLRISNLIYFLNARSLFQPASFCISLMNSPIFKLTLLMDELQTECVEKTAMSIPGIAKIVLRI